MLALHRLARWDRRWATWGLVMTGLLLERPGDMRTMLIQRTCWWHMHVWNMLALVRGYVLAMVRRCIMALVKGHVVAVVRRYVVALVRRYMLALVKRRVVALVGRCIVALVGLLGQWCHLLWNGATCCGMELLWELGRKRR